MIRYDGAILLLKNLPNLTIDSNKKLAVMYNCAE